jgi:hypothetical protein
MKINKFEIIFMVIKMKKGKYRDKCGDCFYNGECLINLKDCSFLKKRPKNEEEE